MDNRILWKIGALAMPLAEQAKVDYLTYLWINNALTDSQYEKAIDRVIEKHIPKDLVKDGEENAAD